MKLVDVTIVAAAFLALPLGTQGKFSFPSDGRELYTYTYYQCNENGKTVSISENCCEETAAVQAKAQWLGLSDGEPVCQQVNMGDLLANLTTYCEIALDGNSVNCTYDVKANNPSCAQKTRDACLANGGRIFSSDLVVECDGMKTETKNSLSALKRNSRSISGWESSPLTIQWTTAR